MPLNDLTVALLAVVIVLAITLVWLVTRRKRSTPRARLRKNSRDLLEQVYVPDGEGGLIHLEYALLCSRGIVVLNIKDIEGHVFGSDSMDEVKEEIESLCLELSVKENEAKRKSANSTDF